MQRDAVESYSEILEEERAACLAADFEKLGQIVEKKEKLYEILGELGHEVWGPLLEQSSRNQKLLTAAMSGIKNARDRANGIPTTQFKTYSKSGEINESHGRGNFERKA